MVGLEELHDGGGTKPLHSTRAASCRAAEVSAGGPRLALRDGDHTAAVGVSVGLEALEDFLPVQDGRGRLRSRSPVGLDRVVVRALPLHDGHCHVVGEVVRQAGRPGSPRPRRPNAPGDSAGGRRTGPCRRLVARAPSRETRAHRVRTTRYPPACDATTPPPPPPSPSSAATASAPGGGRGAEGLLTAAVGDDAFPPRPRPGCRTLAADRPGPCRVGPGRAAQADATTSAARAAPAAR